MTTLPLLTSVSTALDSNGNGTIATGPTAQGEVWTVSTVGVQCSTNVNESICSIYVGPAGSTSHLLGATNWGSTGDSDTGITQVLRVGQAVMAVWKEGDAGATASLSVIGSRTV